MLPSTEVYTDGYRRQEKQTVNRFARHPDSLSTIKRCPRANSLAFAVV